MYFVRGLIFILFLLSGICRTGIAQAIFREVRPNGSIVFTDKPKNSEMATEVNLKPIPRFKSEHITQKKLQESCIAHGGNNCSAGADTDGSVICQDGFKDSPNRFNLSCTQSKLAVDNLETTLHSAKVLIRNSSAVSAEGIKLILPQINGEKDIEFTGPTMIEPFGAGDYSLNLLNLQDKYSGKLVDKLVISCRNCQ